MSDQSFRKTQRWRKAAAMAKRLSDGTCYLCGQPMDFTLRDRAHPLFIEVDHVVPVDRGGELFEQENLQAVHLRCNRIKGTRSVDDLRMQRAVALAEAAAREVTTMGIDFLEEDCE